MLRSVNSSSSRPTDTARLPRAPEDLTLPKSTFDPDTWFDLPAEIKDNIMEHVFTGVTVVYKPEISSQENQSIGYNIVAPVLSVSRRFIDKEQAVSALLRSATLALVRYGDMKTLKSSLTATELSSVKSIAIRFGLENEFKYIENAVDESTLPPFDEIRSLFSTVKEIRLNDQSDSLEPPYLPELRMDEEAEIWPWADRHENAAPEIEDFALADGCQGHYMNTSALSMEYNVHDDIREDYFDWNIAQDAMGWQLAYFVRTDEQGNVYSRNKLATFMAEAMASGVVIDCRFLAHVSAIGCECQVWLEVRYLALYDE
ncbi:hypothetical protein PMZ80_007084 [Knufia obscura]|uniref:Uncharacterized protein n=2 Tax=Knufia TaxID=430999 RepID=A0AAN8EJV9_9EURO|nr:hypothetical protein PMZ80_007084 [Knufia obscura]KAK5953093.1 hypothetical protein OHC33_005661 [Knufia fluminis]